MNVVILAGGYGTRLHEKTHKIPKPMVNIGRKPMLLHIVDYFLKFNCRKFIVCSGYKSNYITNYLEKNYKKKDKRTFIYKNAEIKVINTGVKTNTGGRIYAIREYLEEPSSACIFEWPINAKSLLPEPDYQVNIKHLNETEPESRKITIK